MTEIQVTALSRPDTLAYSVADQVRGHGRAVLQAIGAGAVHQAVKAVAIAASFLALDSIRAVCVPTLAEVEVEGAERQAVRITVEVQPRD